MEGRNYEPLVIGAGVTAFVLFLFWKYFKEHPLKTLKEDRPDSSLHVPIVSKPRTYSNYGWDRLFFEEHQIVLSSQRPENLHVPRIVKKEDDDVHPNPMLGEGHNRSIEGGDGFIPESVFNISGGYVIAEKSFREGGMEPRETVKYLLGDVRKEIFFIPSSRKVAVATCGGLCPGMNVVIRELVMVLHYNYGCKDISGIMDGYRGFYTPGSIIPLNPTRVMDIHTLGGTILKTSRGGMDVKKICDSIESNGFNMVFLIGGDGTHRGIMVIAEELKTRGSSISLIGIPKTIDNDIPIIDQSFGFQTSVEEAQKAINSANTEANSVDLGVGLVKLMGRNSGFIAMMSSIANRDVNICLIPESPFELQKLYEHIYERLQKKRHCVFVVAEGAASACVDKKLSQEGTDASGNPLLYDIGTYLKKEIVNYCKSRGAEITLKYIDPTYMIRTVPANSTDKYLCVQLVQAAVNGAFAGYTCFSVGTIGGRAVLIPIEDITTVKEGMNSMPGQRRVNPDRDTLWWRLMASTGQPTFITKK